MNKKYTFCTAVIVATSGISALSYNMKDTTASLEENADLPRAHYQERARLNEGKTFDTYISATEGYYAIERGNRMSELSNHESTILSSSTEKGTAVDYTKKIASVKELVVSLNEGDKKETNKIVEQLTGFNKKIALKILKTESQRNLNKNNTIER